MKGKLPRWPLFLIALPAAVAVWSGWVGLGQLCGFGVIRPLPGIWDAAHLNTAITLPVGVEAYGSYALAAWLDSGTPEAARRFAKWSAIGALGLGMLGQVAYHLLSAAHAARAPWPVVVLVSSLPVIVLGFGAALSHLLRGEGSAPAEMAVIDAPEATADAPGVSLGTTPDTPAVAPVLSHDTASLTTPEAPANAAIKAPKSRQAGRSAKDLERRAKRVMRTRPDISGADLGRALGASPRTGQRLLAQLNGSEA